MKQIALFTAVFVLACFQPVYSQSAYDSAKKLAAESKFLEASGFIATMLKDNPKNTEAMLLAADIYREMDKPDSSLWILQKAFDLDDAPHIARRLAIGQAENKKYDMAVKLLEKLEKTDKSDQDKAATYNALGQVFLLQGNTTKAEYNIIRAREADKKNPTIYITLGDLYSKQKVYELSKTNYEEALILNPKLTDARIKLAQTYYDLAVQERDSALYNELFQRSLIEWNTLAKEDPNNARAFLQQGRILFQASRFGGAAASFYRYAQLRPDQIQGRWYFAQSLFKSGQYDSALIQLNYVYKNSTIDSIKNLAIFYTAQSHFNLKQFDKSVAAYTLARKSMQFDGEELERFGSAAFSAQDTTLAIALYDESINTTPPRCGLMFRYAMLLRDKKMYEKSTQIFTRRISLCQDEYNDKAKLIIAVNLFSDNKVKEAIVALREYLTLDPTSIYARRMLANAFIAEKMTDSARIILTSMFDMAKANPEIQKNEMESVMQLLCKTYLDAKDFGSTVKYGKMWVEYNPDSALGYLILAIGYHGSQDKDNACKTYKESLKRDPTNAMAKKNLGSLGCG